MEFACPSRQGHRLSQLQSLVLGIVCGSIVYLAFAWLVARLLVLHKRVGTEEDDDAESNEPPAEEPKPE